MTLRRQKNKYAFVSDLHRPRLSYLVPTSALNKLELEALKTKPVSSKEIKDLADGGYYKSTECCGLLQKYHFFCKNTYIVFGALHKDGLASLMSKPLNVFEESATVQKLMRDLSPTPDLLN